VRPLDYMQYACGHCDWHPIDMLIATPCNHRNAHLDLCHSLADLQPVICGRACLLEACIERYRAGIPGTVLAVTH
jgi:hypothetical protein